MFIIRAVRGRRDCARARCPPCGSPDHRARPGSHKANSVNVNWAHRARGPSQFLSSKGIAATRAGAIAVSINDETEVDLFSEHFTFPLIFRALEIALEELVAAGYPPEVAVTEVHGSGELGQILTRAAAEVGLYEMLESDGSPACRYAVLTHRETIVDAHHLARTARRLLGRIRDGSFASELVEDEQAGHPRLAKLTAGSHGFKLGDAERRLRMLIGKE